MRAADSQRPVQPTLHTSCNPVVALRLHHVATEAPPRAVVPWLGMSLAVSARLGVGFEIAVVQSVRYADSLCSPVGL